MSDPVDTDALRDRAIDDEALGYPLSAAVQRAAADELDRLRAVIENAPHAYECFADFAPGSHCTCWKADAL